MKIYNQKKLKYLKIIDSILFFVRFFRFPLYIIALPIRVINKKRPDFLIVDGFLIGDTVLARPLIKALLKKYPNTYYLGGLHAKEILQDCKIKIIFNQWPWANYDYTFINLLKQLQIFLFIFFLQPKNIVELRGDLRSLCFLYFTCPQKLIGYSFTGGKYLLDAEPNDMQEIVHLEVHNRKLAKLLGLDYDLNDFYLVHPESAAKTIGLSFSGSLPLKTLPFVQVKNILEYLTNQTENKLVYLKAPKDYFYDQHKQLLIEYNIPVWQGNFKDYFNQIANLTGYIGMDSAGGHIAAMFNIPSIIFFGTQTAEFAKPINSKLVTLEPNELLTCRPCNSKICSNEVFQKCLLSIKKTDIIDALRSILK